MQEAYIPEDKGCEEVKTVHFMVAVRNMIK
jgi:hypothetical protein